jgi:membrane associated rhomboid family serine protease
VSTDVGAVVLLVQEEPKLRASVLLALVYVTCALAIGASAAMTSRGIKRVRLVLMNLVGLIGMVFGLLGWYFGENYFLRFVFPYNICQTFQEQF